LRPAPDGAVDVSTAQPTVTTVGASTAAGRRTWIARIALAGALVASSWTLFASMAHFGEESLQADFSAFYTAGQAARAGLSPYRTYAERDPPLWDGLSAHGASRFLYPPLFASLMAPLTLLPYHLAKNLWMAASLIAVAAALFVFARALRRPIAVEPVLGLAAFVAVFRPLLDHLERGQVDAFVLLATSLALFPLIAGGRDRFGSGLWLALGTALKPNVGALLVFLVMRRRWRAVSGWVAGGVAAVLLTVTLQGAAAFRSYLSVEFPRIAVEGEAHGPGGRLAPEVLARLRGNVDESHTVRDGRVYRLEAFGFVANASLVRLLKRDLELRIGWRRLSLFLLLGLLAAMVAWERRSAATDESTNPLRELAYWQVVMAGLLLCWPLSWAMNVVWLLPSALVVLQAGPLVRGRWARAALAVCILGLVIAAVPDAAFEAAVGHAAALAKYVVAELLVMTSLFALLGHLGGARAEAALQSGTRQ
jgi:hypothetical protein